MIESRIGVLATEEIKDEVLQNFNAYVEREFPKCIQKYIQELEPPKVYPIWTISIETQSIDLTRPLLLELEKEDTFYIFFNEETRILGTGKSKYEALEDFMNSFVEVYTSYKETPLEQLSEKAVKFLEYLGNLIKR